MLFLQEHVTSSVIHSDAFLASPAFLFRTVFRFVGGVGRRRRQAHVQVLHDPTDGQEKHRRYLGGDRGVRADTYRRRHFSWPRVIPSFRIPANFWIFQPRDQTGERSGDCACSRIGSICKNLWERIFVKRDIFPFLFTDGLKFAYSWQSLKMLFSEKIINSFVNDE